MNVEKIAEDVCIWISRMSEHDRNEFMQCNKEDLIVYHSTLGRDIRNIFKLWQTEWDSEIVNGVDCSRNHPDALSMAIIEKVWEKLHERN